MSGNSFFSVVIPLYNKQSNIKATVDSVLNQTYTDFELIIVNDGSTDNSLSIVKSISDPRIIITNKANEGVSSARNAGIRIAKCEYIAFLDGDDLWEEDFLFLMKKLIDDFPEASFFSSQIYRKTNKENLIRNKKHKDRGYIENFFKEEIKAPLLSSSNVIVKKECFEQIGYFNTKYVRGEDRDMWVRLAQNFKMAFEPTPLCYYIYDADDRACYLPKKLEQTYVEFNLSNKSYYEKIYHIRKTMVLFDQFRNNNRYRDVFLLIIRHKRCALELISYMVKDYMNRAYNKIFKYRN
jgi:glycosyltransferase involved in cell wall biosynthesis